MISYELALKLKKAGFPQKGNQGFDNKGLFIPHFCGFDTQYEAIVPTLSELIRACGDGFYSLHRLFNDDWAVNSDVELNAETPEEAVAKLWLKLNENAN